MFNSNAWMILYYDTWPIVNMPHGTFKQILYKILILNW
jgi:hypothetical protein